MRNRAKHGEIKLGSELIKNGKFFIPPSRDGSDFKGLFQRLAAAGAGRPVDKGGFPMGPWTSDKLADAISEIDATGAGVDLRTVQLWFQDNEKGISAENIRKLARIFGCGDPKATSDWQVELTASVSQLASKRRDRQVSQAVLPDNRTNFPLTPSDTDEPMRRRRGFNLALETEATIFDGSPLDPATWVFGGAVALGFISVFLGIHDVTLHLQVIGTKQVGFLWAPNWTVLFFVFLPLFLALCVDLVKYWKERGRAACFGNPALRTDLPSWHSFVASTSTTYWTVLLICLLFAGLFQWIFVRLLPLAKSSGQFAIDWGTVALVRPEHISVSAEIVFTGVAYLFMALCFYLLFAALILLHTVVRDFLNIQSSSSEQAYECDDIPTPEVGFRVIVAAYKCASLGILIAICMKLQGCYLTSDGKDIISWLVGDFASGLSGLRDGLPVAAFSKPNHFSSLVVALSAVFVFAHAAGRIRIENPLQPSRAFMIVSVLLLFVGYLAIGVFVGFSVLLAVALMLTLSGLVNPAFLVPRRENAT